MLAHGNGLENANFLSTMFNPLQCFEIRLKNFPCNSNMGLVRRSWLELQANIGHIQVDLVNKLYGMILRSDPGLQDPIKILQ